MKKFSVTEALSVGWNIFTKNPWLYIGIFLVYGLLPYAIQYGAGFLFKPLQQMVDQNQNMQYLEILLGIKSLILQIIIFVVSSFLSAGILGISLSAVRGKTVVFSDLFTQKKNILGYIVASFIIGLVSIPAYILFIIPGIIWTTATYIALYLVIDKQMNPVLAIQESMRLTKGSRMTIFLWGIVSVILTIAGAIPLFLGLLIVPPITTFAHAYIYTKLIPKKTAK